MKTHIKTKDLLTLIDPATTGIIYEGNNILIDFTELKKFVDSPKTHKVFTKSENSTENLYKNVALYILNPSEEPVIVSIDLDAENPIKNGLFEYLKAIHSNQPNIYLSLPEQGDNLLFIKSKNLIDIENSPFDHPKYFKEAKDIQLGNLSSIFLQTKKFEPEEIKQINKITEGNKFYWKESNEDIYSNVDYLMYEIQEILKKEKYGKDSPIEADLFTLFTKANAEVLATDEFKLRLLELNDHHLTNLLFTSTTLHKIKHVSIDLNNPIYQEKILSDIKNERFQLLDFAFKKHVKYNKNNYELIKTHIDFHSLINQPETIKYLEQKYDSGSFADYGEKGFTIVAAYPYLNEENKFSDKVIAKYMSCITRQTMNRETYISETPLFKLPVELFQKEDFLNGILPYISIKELHKFFTQQGVKSEKLTDKDYVAKIANYSKISCYDIDQILTNFFTKDSIDKDFFQKLLLAKKDLFSHFFKDKDNNYKAELYSKFVDFDLIYDLAENGLTFYNIPSKMMKDYLLVDSQNKYKEKFKLDYLIDHQLLNKYGKGLFDNPEDVKAFEKKFIKIENLFFAFKDYTYENKPRDNALGKIKTKSKIFDILDKIENTLTDSKFDSRSFYKALNPELKKDMDIVGKLMESGRLSYTDLPEALQFNKDIAIKCISQSHFAIKDVPVEFFNDTEFSIQFAKLLDNGSIKINQAPLFITKFFENQGVEQDYSKYLKSYILNSSIHNKIEEEVPYVANKVQGNKRKI